MSKKNNEREDTDKKQLLLRMSSTLWNEINLWAQDEFRSINGQIEYILTQAVRKRKASHGASGNGERNTSELYYDQAQSDSTKASEGIPPPTH